MDSGDLFASAVIYTPLWILLGGFMAIPGLKTGIAKAFWAVATLVVMALAWYSAAQTHYEVRLREQQRLTSLDQLRAETRTLAKDLVDFTFSWNASERSHFEEEQRAIEASARAKTPDEKLRINREFQRQMLERYNQQVQAFQQQFGFKIGSAVQGLHDKGIKLPRPDSFYFVQTLNPDVLRQIARDFSQAADMLPVPSEQQPQKPVLWGNLYLELYGALAAAWYLFCVIGGWSPRWWPHDWIARSGF